MCSVSNFRFSGKYWPAAAGPDLLFDGTQTSKQHGPADQFLNYGALVVINNNKNNINNNNQ